MRFRIVQKHGSRSLAIINPVLRILQLICALVVLINWCMLAAEIKWHDLAKFQSSEVPGKTLLQVIEVCDRISIAFRD